MSKAILLIRVSSVYQEFESQTEEVKELAIRDGYQEKDLIIIEDKESGSKLDEHERHGLNEMKKYIEEEPSIDCVYAYEISRLSRKTKIVYSIRDYLLDRKIQLVICKPYFKLLDDNKNLNESANIFFGIFASLAEQETYLRVSRIKRGKIKAKSLGKWTGGWIKYGYTIDSEKYFILKEDEASVVRDIFNWYSLGEMSAHAIANELLATGRISYDRIVMAINFIIKVLNSEEYTGSGLYPSIISKELFEHCQKVKNDRNDNKPKSCHKYVFYCKKLLRLENGWFLVAASNTMAYRHKEAKFQVGINVIDSAVWELAKARKIMNIDRSDNIKKLVDDIATLERKIEVCDNKISNLDEQIQTIEIRLIKKKLRADVAEKLESEIETQISELKKDKSRYESELNIKNIEFKGLSSSDSINVSLDDIKDDTGRKNIVNETIKEIIVKRIDFTHIEMNVHYMYDDSDNIYELDTRNYKMKYSGIEIPFENLNRYNRK